jgi:ethanolamine transporter
MLKVFRVFTYILKVILTVGLVLGAVKQLTGAQFLPGLMPLPEAMEVVCSVCVFLLGSLPVALLLQRVLKKPLGAVGKLIGVNETSMAALLIGFVSAMPVFAMAKDMDPKGKLLNLSFIFCSTAVFGAHLGFTSSVAPDYLGALIVAKLAGALAAARNAAGTEGADAANQAAADAVNAANEQLRAQTEGAGDAESIQTN